MRRILYITLISSIIFPFYFSNALNKASAKTFAISNNASSLKVLFANLESEYYRKKKESERALNTQLKCFEENLKDAIYTQENNDLLAYVIRENPNGTDYFEIWYGCNLSLRFEVGKIYLFRKNVTCNSPQYKIQFTKDREPYMPRNAYYGRYIVYYTQEEEGVIERAIFPAGSYFDNTKILNWDFDNQCEGFEYFEDFE